MLAVWKIAFSADFHDDIKDMVQEGDKVWVYGRITGMPVGVVKDSVDMMVWNEEGKMKYYKAVQREVSDEV